MPEPTKTTRSLFDLRVSRVGERWLVSGPERQHRNWLREHKWRWDWSEREWYTTRSEVAGELEGIIGQWGTEVPSVLTETPAELAFAKKIGAI